MSVAATNQANLDDSEALTVFTFWIGDELFAIDIANILSITQDLDSLLKTPVNNSYLIVRNHMYIFIILILVIFFQNKKYRLSKIIQ